WNRSLSLAAPIDAALAIRLEATVRSQSFLWLALVTASFRDAVCALCASFSQYAGRLAISGLYRDFIGRHPKRISLAAEHVRHMRLMPVEELSCTRIVGCLGGCIGRYKLKGNRPWRLLT